MAPALALVPSPSCFASLCQEMLPGMRLERCADAEDHVSRLPLQSLRRFLPLGTGTQYSVAKWCVTSVLLEGHSTHRWQAHHCLMTFDEGFRTSTAKLLVRGQEVVRPYLKKGQQHHSATAAWWMKTERTSPASPRKVPERILFFLMFCIHPPLRAPDTAVCPGILQGMTLTP